MNADQTPQDNKDKDAGEPTFAPSETAPERAPEAAPDAAPDAPGAQAEAGTETPGDAGEADPTLAADANAHIEHLEGELVALNDKLLRALAEAENVRRRAQRDKEDASKYAIKGFAEDMLRVGDNLSRALAAIDGDARKADANLDNLAVGVEMVMKELLSAFDRAGVKPIEAEGSRFDPMLHEAMYEIDDATKPAGTVAHVLEQGFTLHGRTLRAAKVGVTKGGPKPEAPAADGAALAGGQSREGQHAYEHRSDAKASGQGGAGHQFDEKL
jgi:molecular chaperone GrpE